MSNMDTAPIYAIEALIPLELELTHDKLFTGGDFPDMSNDDSLDRLKFDEIIPLVSDDDLSPALTGEFISTIDDASADDANMSTYCKAFSFIENRSLRELANEIVPDAIYNREQPFLIIDIIQQGVIAIINGDTTFESRVILDQPVLAIQVKDLEFATKRQALRHKGTRAPLRPDQSVIQQIPSGRSINVLGFIVPPQIIRQLVPNNPPLFNASALYVPQPAPFASRIMINTGASGVLKLRELHASLEWSQTFLMGYSAMREAAYRQYRAATRGAGAAPVVLVGVPVMPTLYNWSMELMSFFADHNLLNFVTPSADAVLSIIDHAGIWDHYVAFLNGITLDTNGRSQVFKVRTGTNGESALMLSQYRYAYRMLYGIQRYNKLPVVQTSEQFLRSIKAVERADVVAEHVRLTKYWNAYITNTCDHLALYKTLLGSLTQDASREAWIVLKPFINMTGAAAAAKGSRDRYYQCRVCKLDLICPHSVILAEHAALGPIGDRRYVQTRHELLPFIDHTIVDTRTYYCRICGERLFDQDESIGVVAEPTITDTDRSLFWSEAGILINKYTKFNEFVNNENLIRSIISHCQPFVADFARKLSIRAGTETEYQLIVKTIFAAFMANLTHGSRGRIVFDTKGFERSYSIRDRERFKKLLQEMRLKLTNVSFNDDTDNESDRLMRVATDAVLQFTLYMDRSIPRTPASLLRLTPVVLPGTVGINMYSRLRPLVLESILPSGAPVDYLKKLHDIAFVRGIKLVNAAIAASIRFTILLLCYNRLVLYLKRGSWLKPPIDIYTPDMNSPLNTSPDTLILIAALNELYESYCERVARPNRYHLPVKKTLVFYRVPSRMGEIYNVHGVRHVWDRFIYADGKMIERANIPPKHGPLVDRYATNTATFRSIAGTIANADVIDGFNIYSKIIALFNYFSNQCPEGGFHNKVDAVCAKCGIVDGMTGAAQRDYYTKYAAAVVAPVATINVDAAIIAPADKPDPEAASIDPIYNWTVEVAQNAADRAGVPLNALRFLGNLRGYFYDDIISGAITPAFPSTALSIRLFILDTHIRNYFIFKNAHGLFGPAFAQYCDKFRNARVPTPIRDFVQWQVMFLCYDIIQLFDASPELCKDIVKRITHDDSLLCMNTPIVHTSIIDDQINDSDRVDLEEKRSRREDDEAISEY